MNSPKPRLFVTAAVFLVVAFASAQYVPNAPVVNALIPELQGKSREEVRIAIIHRVGWPAREVGSGLQIEQWDVDGGVLTFHPVEGPNFQRYGQRTWLIHTNNPVALNLFGKYEMYTTPEGGYRMRYWLGNLSLSGDAYTYTDNRQNLEHPEQQKTNFFMHHTSGSVEVRYPQGVTPKTRLEDMPDDSTVAILTFISPDRQFRKTYRIVTNRTSMSLAFGGKDMSFEMTKSWENFWR